MLSRPDAFGMARKAARSRIAEGNRQRRREASLNAIAAPRGRLNGEGRKKPAPLAALRITRTGDEMHRYELPFWPTFGTDFAPLPEHIDMLAEMLQAGKFRAYVGLIHPSPEHQRDIPSLGLAENPGAKHPNSRWRRWRDDYLGELARQYPACAGVHIERHEVNLVLRWREAIPPEWRIWEHD